MARPTISEEQRKREGAAVKRHYEAAKQLEPTLTQDQIAGEMDVSQGLIGQWFSGKTPIPDKRLIWLGARLNFDPVKLRPEIIKAQSDPSSGTSRLSQVMARIPKEEEDWIADIVARLLEGRK